MPVNLTEKAPKRHYSYLNLRYLATLTEEFQTSYNPPSLKLRLMTEITRKCWTSIQAIVIRYVRRKVLSIPKYQKCSVVAQKFFFLRRQRGKLPLIIRPSFISWQQNVSSEFRASASFMNRFKMPGQTNFSCQFHVRTIHFRI